MKYLDAKFSTPGNSQAYVDGWERAFGEEEVEVVASRVDPSAGTADEPATPVPCTSV